MFRWSYKCEDGLCTKVCIDWFLVLTCCRIGDASDIFVMTRVKVLQGACFVHVCVGEGRKGVEVCEARCSPWRTSNLCALYRRTSLDLRGKRLLGVVQVSFWSHSACAIGPCAYVMWSVLAHPCLLLPRKGSMLPHSHTLQISHCNAKITRILLIFPSVCDVLRFSCVLHYAVCNVCEPI